MDQPEIEILDTAVKQEIETDSREMCRLCAKRFDGKSTSIFHEDLHVNLIELFNCSIADSDSWPKTVCDKCVKKAEKAIKFVRNLRKSEEVFQTIYGDAAGDGMGMAEVEPPSTVQFIVTELSPEKPSEIVEKSIVVPPPPSTTIRRLARPPVRPVRPPVPLPVRLPVPPPARPPVRPPQTNIHAKDLLGGKTCEQMLKELLPDSVSSSSTVLSPSMITMRPIEETYREISEFYSMFCELCRLDCKTLKNLRAHFRNNHNEIGFVVCCKKKIHRDSDILDHMTYHRNPQAFKCSLCKKSKDLDGKTALRRHMETSHAKIFEKRGEVYSTLTNNTTKTVRQPCSHCKRFYFISPSMAKFVKSNSKGNEIKDICLKCKKVFKCKIALEKHMRMHEMKGQSTPSATAGPSTKADNDDDDDDEVMIID